MENGDYENAVPNSVSFSNNNNNEESFHRQGFQKFVISIVDNKLFGGTILFIILLNTIILIIQTDEKTSVKGGIVLYINFS